MWSDEESPITDEELKLGLYMLLAAVAAVVCVIVFINYFYS